jgi:hypothetical protein
VTEQELYKARAQAMKASKLAGYLWAFRQDGIDITGAKVRALPEAHKRMAELVCDLPLSSDTTWELVAQVIDGMLAHPLPADPFEGLT